MEKPLDDLMIKIINNYFINFWKINMPEFLFASNVDVLLPYRMLAGSDGKQNAVVSNENKQHGDHATTGRITISTLPLELLYVILIEVMSEEWRLVAKFVCRQWHEIVSTSARRSENNASTYECKEMKRLMSHNLYHRAASENCLQLFKWAKDNGCPGDMRIYIGIAAHEGHLELVQYINEKGHGMGTWTCAYAARAGQLEVLKWLKARGCPWDKWTCANAAYSGHLETLEWARSLGCPWDATTCAEAAAGGYLDVLIWAHACGCPWDEATCNAAAGGGHLEILKWAHENGCPWDEWTCAHAAKHGRLELLKWIKGQACPWDTWTCESAASAGHLDVLEWARSQGCPWDERTTIAAAQNGHLEVVQWALQNGCPCYHHTMVLCRIKWPFIFN